MKWKKNILILLLCRWIKMVTYYITGNSFHLKEEIKLLKPKRKNFNNWWIFNYDFKCWELEVPNNINSNKFEKELTEFCEKNNLKLEVCSLTKPLIKSIKDFKTAEEYFQYFHNQNQKRRFL